MILDPYCSPLSTRLYRLFHHERTDLDARPFETASDDDPLASNQALATLAFYRHAAELTRRWPELVLRQRRRLAFVAYPLSGGFTGRRLVPHRAGLVLQRAERRLSPFGRLLAFRCLVVLERARAT